MVHHSVPFVNGKDTKDHSLDFGVGSSAPRVVLVGLDASQLSASGPHSSLHAAAHAAGLARREEARLVAVWVRPRIAPVDRFAETVETIAGEREDREDEVRGLVNRAAAHFGIPTPSLVVAEGDPFEQLTATAEREGADLIVVGASEHRLGSLAAHLIRDGRWPVTVVP